MSRRCPLGRDSRAGTQASKWGRLLTRALGMICGAERKEKAVSRQRGLIVLVAGLLASLALLAVLASDVLADEGKRSDLTQGLANPDLPGQDQLTFPNLGSALSDVADGSWGSLYGADFAFGGDSGSDAPTGGVAASPFDPADSGNQTATMVALSIIVDGNVQRVVNVINNNGGDVRNVLDNYIEAYVPTTALATLARTPGVSWARELDQPMATKGRVTSGGVAQHLANAWHSDGIKGQGVKVGVIDITSTRTSRDGFTGTPALMGTDLPSTIVALCYTDVGTYTSDIADCSNATYGSGLPGGPSAGSTHGTRVAETVMDIAPEASLYISNGTSAVDFRKAVEWMHGQGVKVIVYSVNWSYHGPPDGTTPYKYGALETVRWAADNGIVWVNAAGNHHLDGWYGTPTDADNDNILEWEAGEEDKTLSLLPGSSARVYMRWDDVWFKAVNDLSLVAVSNAGQPNESVIATSNDAQDGGDYDVPKEWITLTNPGSQTATVALRVKSMDGSKPSWVQLVVWGGVLARATNGYSVGSPADSPHLGVLGVGAGSPTGLHSYSSRGPTPDGRIKPDIIGAAGHGTATRPSFFGTSAAAPHVGGLAALVAQQNPSFTPTQTTSYLKTHAAPRGTPVPNSEWGHGFAQLPSLSCVDDLISSGSTSGSWSTSCISAINSQKSSRYYTFSLAQQATVTIDLSSTLDSYLNLRSGYNAQKGAALHQDDNSGSGNNARLSQTLDAGSYTVEATTAVNSRTGAFSLSVSGLTATPIVSLSGGSDVTEGSSASFTLTATPAPSSPLSVKVQVAATGDFDASPTGLQTVTIPTTGSATLSVTTVGDNQAEPGGIISAQLLSSSHYRLSASASKRVVAIKDDDKQTIRITADGDIAEAEDAIFRIKSSDGGAVKDVKVAVSLTGDILVAQQVIPPVMTVDLDDTGEAVIKLDSQFDTEQEPHGLIALRLQSASHYDIDQNAAVANVIVYDNDVESCVEHLYSNIQTPFGYDTAECPSPRDSNRTSWYYTFRLSQRLTVTMELWGNGDQYLYLRQGRLNKSGTALHEDDNGGIYIHGAGASRILQTLDPGWYTVETTTVGTAPQGGGATFLISGLTPLSAKGVEVSVIGGPDVDEGGTAKFTLAAHPLPSSPLTVNVDITTKGDFGITNGSHTVTIPTNTGRAELKLATTDDYAVEDNGAVTATVTAGTGYDVSPTKPSSRVGINDAGLDPCFAPLPANGKASGTWSSNCDSVDLGGRYARFYTFELKQTTDVTIDLTSQHTDTFLLLRRGNNTKSGAPIYQDDDGGNGSNSRISETLNIGWYTIEATTFSSSTSGTFQLNVSGLPAPSEISIASDGDVTEGTDATFTLTASPKPTANLDVTVEVTQSGDFITTGSHTVTITTSGTATLTVPTIDDSIDEVDGSVTATISTGTEYRVSTTAGAATANVADDEISEISITADGDITEDERAYFRLKSSAGVPVKGVRVNASWVGDIDVLGGITPGVNTVTLDDNGEAVIVVRTQGDTVQEPHGLISVRLESASHYDIVQNAAAASVIVYDNDVEDCVEHLRSDTHTSYGFYPNTCPSPRDSNRTSWYYTFQLLEQRTVTMNIWGFVGDNYLYLRQGRINKSGPALHEDAQGGSGGARPTISQELAPGWYTIEGTTFGSITPGSTEFIIDGLPPMSEKAVEVSVDGGADVDEGGDVKFTVAAHPLPATPITANVEISSNGDFGVTTETRTVTIPTNTGKAELVVSTSNDTVRENSGSVIATVTSGTGYDVSYTLPQSSVKVFDNDFECTEALPANGKVTDQWTPKCPAVHRSTSGYASYHGRFYTFELNQSATVTIDLTSDEVDPILLLYNTNNVARLAELYEHDNIDRDGGNRNSRIEEALPAGKYTIEAATSRYDKTGRFQLSVAGLPSPSAPVISIASNGDVTEGIDATFTLTANPKPTANIDVTVEVTQSGDYVTTGSKTVTITTSGTATLSVPTTDDAVTEVDGSVTATISTGTGYSVSANNGAATTNVADDDGASPCKTQLTVDGTIEGNWISGCKSATRIGRNAHFYTFQLTQQSDVTITLTSSHDTFLFLRAGDDTRSGPAVAFNDDIGGSNLNSRIIRTLNAGWYTIEATTFTRDRTGDFKLEISGLPAQASVPEISIAADADITEGGDATFTVTATPNPSADLDVTVEVSQSGYYASTGSQTVTIPSTGSQTLTVTTTNDATDEPDGSVTATISTGTGYTVSSSASAATVAVSDDDVPEISITAGTAITEGGDATFTITATPTPSADLDVTVEVSQSGDYASTGSQTVTIPSTGSQTLTVTTTDDANDEPDGSVTATISTGTGYTVSSSASAATVAVSDDDTSSLPDISIAAGADIVEGGGAKFTITATPPPSAQLTVNYTVSQSGDFGVSVTTGNVNIYSGGSSAITITTTNDDTSEADGSVSVTLSTSQNYTVSTSAGSATVTVSDDDGVQLPPQSIVDSCVSDSLLTTVRRYYDANKDRAPSYGRNWKRVLITFRDVQDSQLTPFTAAEALAGEQVWFGWRPIREALECIEAAIAPPPPTEPEISIAAGNDVTEGTDATFTVTATPAPSADLDVTVGVSQSGDYVTTGSRTVTITTTGSATFTVATTNDTTDEPDGSVTASISSGTGYTVSSNAGAATVAVSDNDAATLPEISITSGSGVTEGTAASFTLTASPAPAADLDVRITFSQSGDYVTTGSHTVTIPTSGSKTFSVATTDDNNDEPDGSVTATISSATGYTVASNAGAATVAVSDNDAPTLPEISITAGSGVTEGTAATFTLTASPTPAADLDITVAVSQSGDYVTTGSRTVTIPASGSKIFTVTTTDDSDDEPDGSVTVSINNGTSYTVSSSSSTATVAIADNDTCAPTLPTDAVTIAEITGWRDALDPTRAAAGIKRFNRVLATLGVDTGETPMTVQQAQAVSNWLKNTRWDRIARTLAAIEQSQCDTQPPTEPVITITAGSDITEGSDASFTVTASPTPTSALTVNLTVSQSGHFGATTGADTVTIPTSGSTTFTVSTTNDNTDEPHGSVTATLSTGTGYTVSGTNNAATVAVSDDDDPPPATPTISIAAGSGVTEGSDATFTVTASPAPATALTVNLTVSQSGSFGAITGTDTVIIPTTGSATFTVSTTNDSTDEPDGSVTATLSTGTGYTVSGSNNAATVAVADDDDPPEATPTISIAAGSGVTEGSDATFTVTASPAPATALTVNLTVSQSGSFGAITGTDTVIIPTTGSATFTVSTTNDSTDEPDGSVTATLSTGTGYTVSGSNNAATVAVSDDDDPPAVTPTISIAAGSGVTEGSDATFTVTASPAPATALTVNLTVSQSGSFGADTGTDTVIIPTTGSATFTVSTTNDNTDEPHGSVTATLSTGTGYTVSSTSNAATVAVSDDDDPPPAPPTISIAAGSGVTEGSDATFTVTANPAPASPLTVNLTVSQSGNFGATTGADTVTIPTTGSATFTVSTTNDNTDEPDGSVTATLSTGTGYTVSGSSNAATVAVSDNDDPQPVNLPTVSISDAQEYEDYVLMEFYLQLSYASSVPVTVTIEFEEGTATYGGDFLGIDTTQTIAPGQTRKALYVPLRADGWPEVDETFAIKLTSATGATIADDTGNGTILNDD